MELKIIINDPKSKKSYKRVLPENIYLNKKIQDHISGSSLDLPGYELQITGGSDASGFGMRPDLNITGKKKLLLTSGTGIHLKRKGMQKRKTVAGNIIHQKTAAINAKITKYGNKTIEECWEIKPKEKVETKEQEKS